MTAIQITHANPQSAASIIANAKAVRARLLNPMKRGFDKCEMRPKEILPFNPIDNTTIQRFGYTRETYNRIMIDQELKKYGDGISRDKQGRKTSRQMEIIYLQDAHARLKASTEPESIPERLNIPYINSVVAKYFNVLAEKLQGQDRHMIFMFPRMIAYLICKDVLDLSYPQIASWFNDRDHTTILYAVRKMQSMKETDATLRETIDMLTAKIRGE
jgi:Bacterial dnaA protein helix-turn-helix